MLTLSFLSKTPQFYDGKLVNIFISMHRHIFDGFQMINLTTCMIDNLMCGSSNCLGDDVKTTTLASYFLLTSHIGEVLACQMENYFCIVKYDNVIVVRLTR